MPFHFVALSLCHRITLSPHRLEHQYYTIKVAAELCGMHEQSLRMYERRGDDLETAVQTDLYTMLLGGTVRVPIIGGKTISLNVPANTPNGKKFRITGQGMPRLRAPETRGDLYVKLETLLPVSLSTRERELVEELRELTKPTR